jgi:hypothetical protein
MASAATHHQSSCRLLDHHVGPLIWSKLHDLRAVLLASRAIRESVRTTEMSPEAKRRGFEACLPKTLESPWLADPKYVRYYRGILTGASKLACSVPRLPVVVRPPALLAEGSCEHGKDTWTSPASDGEAWHRVRPMHMWPEAPRVVPQGARLWSLVVRGEFIRLDVTLRGVQLLRLNVDTWRLLPDEIELCQFVDVASVAWDEDLALAIKTPPNWPGGEDDCCSCVVRWISVDGARRPAAPSLVLARPRTTAIRFWDLWPGQTVDDPSIFGAASGGPGPGGRGMLRGARLLAPCVGFCRGIIVTTDLSEDGDCEALPLFAAEHFYLDLQSDRDGPSLQARMRRTSLQVEAAVCEVRAGDAPEARLLPFASKDCYFLSFGEDSLHLESVRLITLVVRIRDDVEAERVQVRAHFLGDRIVMVKTWVKAEGRV